MKIHRKSRIATAVAALLAVPALPSTALAEEAQQAVPLPHVLVTGSNIKRIDVETSDSVFIVRRDDIERSGATTLAELLDKLPWTTPSLKDAEGATAFASGATAVSMRNLGKQATLVLLNGRRLAPHGVPDFGETFTNIDTLPLDAVERVEVLKSGASAIYGTDAVAGVINIITRPDYQGFEFGADMALSVPGGKFGSRSVYATAGFGDLKADGYNLVGNVQLYQRDAVVWRDVFDRASASSRAYLPQGAAQLSTYSSPGNIGGAAVPGCATEMLVDGVCMYDRYSRFEAMPAAERANLLLAGRMTMTPSLEAFSELLLSRTKTTYRQPFADYGLGDPIEWGNSSTGALEQFNYFPLPSTHPLNGTGGDAELRYRFVDSDAHGVSTGTDYRLVAGLRGNIAGYEWESALAFMGSSARQKARGNFSRSGFASTIGGSTDTRDPNSPIDPNFFNLPGGYRIGQDNSAQVLDTLFPRYGTNGRTTQVAWDAKLTGELGELDAGPIGFAAGYDLRREKFTVSPSDNLLAGDVVGVGVSQTDGARTFGAVFGELSLPLAPSLEAQVAARVDKFPAFGAHLSPKLGLRYQPTKELLLRGTVESGFRAPNLTEAAKTRHVAFENTSDPKRCAAAIDYAADLRAQADGLPASDPAAGALRMQADRVYNNECQGAVAVMTNENPDLKPETSRSYTLGLLFEPVKELSLALDYWSIHRKDQIRTLDAGDLLMNEDELPAGTITRAALGQDPTFTTPELRQRYDVTAGRLLGVMERFENTTRTKSDGLDVTVNSRIATPVGALDLGLLGTYLHSYRSSGVSGGGYGDELAGTWGMPRWKGTLSGALSTGPYVNGLTLAYESGTKSPIYCGAEEANYCAVGSSVRFDYFFAFNGIRDLTFTAYVRNLFDRKPPLDYLAMRLDGFNVPPVEEAIGRSVRFAVNYKFR